MATTDLITNEALLLSLPAELRNKIYELALISALPINVIKPQGSRQPALLRSCKQIRSEAMEIYYTSNTFQTARHEQKGVSLQCTPWKWLYHLGAEKRDMVRELRHVRYFVEDATRTREWVRKFVFAMRCWEMSLKPDVVWVLGHDEKCKKIWVSESEVKEAWKKRGVWMGRVATRMLSESDDESLTDESLYEL